LSIEHSALNIRRRRRPAGLGEGLRLPLAWLPGGPSPPPGFFCKERHE